MNIGDKIYVIDWGKTYELMKWCEILKNRTTTFPFKTEIPDYSSVDFHWKCEYEPNLTLKGTVNKKDPKKLKSKTPIYKEWKYEILEIIKHPKAGEYYYDNEEQRAKWGYDKYSNEDIFLIKAIDKDCYIIISEEGVSKLTPEEFADNQFNALINAHLGKYTKENLTQETIKKLPKEIISTIYDSNDNVLFGSSMVKGKVSYDYLEGKFTQDGIPLYLNCSISYDGKGNSDLPNNITIDKFENIKAMFPHNQ